MKTNFLALCMFASIASAAWGQASPRPAESIWLAAAELRLGHSREAVLASLADCCTLQRLATGDDWFVESKGDRSEKYGQVSFSGGKLVLVVKDWTVSGEDEFTFVQTLHGALAQLGEEGGNVCSFDTDSTRTPVVERRTITWSCGARRLVIQTAEFFSGEYKGTKTATIEELLVSVETN